MDEPPFRFSTKKALDELATELNLREKIPHWDSMAGLSYTPGNPEDIQTYLVYYAQLKDDDKKFTLMEMILDSIAQQSNETEFMKYWRKVEPILIKDYVIHEFTIHHWKDMTTQNFERSDPMTPLIRDLISLLKSNGR
ncbi:hypothetical protein [Haliscomenobacter sp.]|uniref:hypothetical protein n=1 Tax=Haliscomenobacter sp. TaxID=2717303 RepID=UPI0035948252